MNTSLSRQSSHDVSDYRDSYSAASKSPAPQNFDGETLFFASDLGPEHDDQRFGEPDGGFEKEIFRYIYVPREQWDASCL